jgi:hypothetical protein
MENEKYNKENIKKIFLRHWKPWLAMTPKLYVLGKFGS